MCSSGMSLYEELVDFEIKVLRFWGILVFHISCSSLISSPFLESFNCFKSNYFESPCISNNTRCFLDLSSFHELKWQRRRWVALLSQHLCVMLLVCQACLPAVRTTLGLLFFLKHLFYLLFPLHCSSWKSCSSSKSPCSPLSSVRVSWSIRAGSWEHTLKPVLCPTHQCYMVFNTTHTQLWALPPSYSVSLVFSMRDTQIMLTATEEKETNTQWNHHRD